MTGKKGDMVRLNLIPEKSPVHDLVEKRFITPAQGNALLKGDAIGKCLGPATQGDRFTPEAQDGMVKQLVRDGYITKAQGVEMKKESHFQWWAGWWEQWNGWKDFHDPRSSPRLSPNQPGHLQTDFQGNWAWYRTGGETGRRGDRHGGYDMHPPGRDLHAGGYGYDQHPLGRDLHGGGGDLHGGGLDIHPGGSDIHGGGRDLHGGGRDLHG